MIPYGKQSILDDDIEAVVNVLKSDFLTQGPAIEKFEQAISIYCKVKYAVAVSNATSALHLACLALGVAQNDIVWTTPNTFVASANCAIFCGASIDFVDIDPQTYNLCPNLLAEKLSFAEKNGCLPKVLIPVHFSGQPCDMKAIAKLAKKYNFSIIEDASHAIGATYAGSAIGSCEYSDITIFSFHPVKIITTGEGGMALTNDLSLYSKLSLLRSHGITRNPDEMDIPTEGGWFYQQIDLGYNYRITDLQAALGLSQLRKLDDFIEKRQRVVDKYQRSFQDLPLNLPIIAEDRTSSWHLYVIHLKNVAKRKKVFEKLRQKQIHVNVHYIPVHVQPFYKKFGFNFGDFPNAENYYKGAITLPLFPTLDEEKQQYVIDQVYEAMG